MAHAQKPRRGTATALRRQANELLRTSRRDVGAMPFTDVQRLVYELQVHQIELALQESLASI